MESHLQLAECHVRDGGARVADQSALIATLRAEGQNIESAQKLLATMEQTLVAMREHLAHERDKSGC